MKNINIILVVVGLIMISCQSNQVYVLDLSDNIEYNNIEIKYFKYDTLDKEPMLYKYFDIEGRLIEQVGNESRIKYKYDINGILVEKYNCRMYDCSVGRRELLFYDKNKNYIGSFFTLDTLVNLDTVKFEQIKYYDKKNNLIMELVDSGKDSKGKIFESWKNYIYSNEKIIKDIELKNNDTIWVGTYKYDNRGNLIEINKVRHELYENEKFEYNVNNQVIRKIIKANKYPLSKNTSYHVKNHSTTFKYDEQNRLIEEITFNHNGEKFRTFLYEYNNKQNTNANKH